MKKVLTFSPLIIAVILILGVLVMFFAGAFDKPEEVTITSSALNEVVQTAKLSTARYIQHGIAKAQVGSQDSPVQGYILYYAIVKPNVELAEITYDVDDSNKIVKVTLPENFQFTVEKIEDEEHKWYYYPSDQAKWTGKDARYICETDAKNKAEQNLELIRKARQGLKNTLESLLMPLLETSGYSLEFIETKE